MIAWCAYCQRYMGEMAPYDSYALSHGLCGDCAARGAVDDPTLPQRIEPVRAFYEGLRRAVATGNAPAAEQSLREARALGLASLDVVLGMLQPVLYEVGDLWARGDVDVAHEHAATRLVRELVELAYETLGLAGRPGADDEARVSLCVAPGNAHTLGVTFLEMALVSRGVPTRTSLAPLDVDEIVARVTADRPGWLGISVALPSQGEMALAVAERVAGLDLPARPRVVMGGHPFRGRPRAEMSSLTVFGNVDDFVALVCAS
jgi:hypothetical protein